MLSIDNIVVISEKIVIVGGKVLIVSIEIKGWGSIVVLEDL